MPKVLVTGASGHLGTNLVRHLTGAGVEVRVLLQPNTDSSGVDTLKVERRTGDLRDAGAVRSAVRGCTRIFHCAARISTVSGGEREIYESNVIGTHNVLAAARAGDIERVVVTGSFGAIGHLDDRPSDERVPFDPFAEHTAYAHTKVLVEHEALRAAADGLDVVVATSCAILGPHDYLPSRLGRTFIKFANGSLRAYVPGGFEFVTARDIVAGHVLAMEKGRPGQNYIFGSGYRSMDDLMSILEQVTGQRRPSLRLPAGLMYRVGRVASPVLTRLAPGREQLLTPAAVRLLSLGRRADCTKARTELGFSPTSIEDAVGAAIEDFARRGFIRSHGRSSAR